MRLHCCFFVQPVIRRLGRLRPGKRLEHSVCRSIGFYAIAAGLSYRGRGQKAAKKRNERRMIKKISNIVLAIALSAVLAACGSRPASKDAEGDSAAVQTTAAGGQVISEQEESTGTGNDSETAAETGQEASSDNIEIPETPYTRDDGGVSLDVFAMDTYMNLLAYGDTAEEAVLAAAQEIHRIDDMLSTGNPESEISKLNAAGTGTVSEETIRLISESQTLYKETGGLFDIAIYPVMKLWGFPTQEYRVPQAEEIQAALTLADVTKITVGDASAPAVPAPENAAAPEADSTAAPAAPADPASAPAVPAPENAAAPEVDSAAAESTGTDAAAAIESVPEAGTAAGAAEAAAPAADPAAQNGAPADASNSTVAFAMPGMEIDLGGIAKGFTSSRVMEVFKEHGVKHGLVSLGGNVQALGSKENGKPWRVAIQNPESEMDYLGVLEVDDKCVITSGGYERFFEQEGVRYHHIIDPRTGYPADSGIISATIISKDGTLADGLSTSLFIMGKDQAEKYWRSNADKFDYILEDKDGRLYVTEGASGILTTDAEIVVVKK